MKITCPNCRHKASFHRDTCPKCGAELKRKAESGTDSSAVASSQPYTSDWQSSSFSDTSSSDNSSSGSSDSSYSGGGGDSGGGGADSTF